MAPLRFIKGLHKYFLSVAKDVVAMDLPIYLVGKHMTGHVVDRGFTPTTAFAPDCELIGEPCAGVAVLLKPYIMPSRGRLLILNRLHIDRAEYVDFSAARSL